MRQFSVYHKSLEAKSFKGVGGHEIGICRRLNLAWNLQDFASKRLKEYRPFGMHRSERFGNDILNLRGSDLFLVKSTWCYNFGVRRSRLTLSSTMKYLFEGGVVK